MTRKLFVLALALVPSLAFAQYRHHDTRRNSGVELTPFVGYQWGGNIDAGVSDLFDRDVKVADGAAFGVALDVPINYNLQLELLANRQQSNFEGDNGLFDEGSNLGDVNLTYYHAGLLWEFPVERNVRPFFVVGAGVTNIDPRFAGASNETKLSGNMGGGVKLFFSDNLALRVEGRGFWTNISDDNNNNDCFRCNNRDHDLYQGEASVGLVIHF